MIWDYVIVGAGTAGIAMACALDEKKNGSSILLVEREEEAGGLLKQCIHEGFGPGGMTGPKYREVLLERLEKSSVTVLLETEVVALDVVRENNIDRKQTRKQNTAVSEVTVRNEKGEEKVSCRTIILATGCYERPASTLRIAGTRPEGIFGAGELQRKINLEGYQPGKRAVIIGSGDIGMIIGRRLVLTGCEVVRIVEILKESPALERNKRNCLEAFGLPLQVNARVIRIHGKETLSAVTVENRETGEREEIPCDLLVCAAGLIPDRTLLNGIEAWENSVCLVGNCEEVYPMAETIVRVAERKAREGFR